MKHVILLIAMAITCVLAAATNVIVTRMIGLNIFTFKLWFIIPAGAIGVGMLGASGAILAARYFHIQATIIDFILMVIVAAATMVLIYYLDYATFVFDDGSKASDFMKFRAYVDLVLTTAHMRIGRTQIDTGEVGQMGYYLAGIEFIGFLIGGAAVFLLIEGLPRCAGCSSYLRRLKTKKTKDLKFDEASKVIELFKAGDLETMQNAMAWSPPNRAFGRKEQKAIVTFDLLGCPKCKTEAISAKVSAFNGKEWKDVSALTTRRNLSSGLSFRDRFV